MRVHPLADSAARLDPWFAFDVGIPAGPGWCSLAEATGLVGEWLDRLPASVAGLRNVAAAGTSLKFANCILRPLMAILHVHRRVPEFSAADVFVHRRDDGIFDRLALARVPVAALADDAAAGSPSVTVLGGPAELVARAADGIHDVFSPVLQAIRLDGRYGLAGLWGGVSDMIGATSLLVARQSGLPQPLVWARTEQLLDELSGHSGHSRPRPTPFTVHYSGGAAMFTVKGTCCLRYREHGLRAGQAPERCDAYCHTCPFADETLRRRHYATEMERRHTGR